MKILVSYLLATILAGFGLLTLFLSTSVIFDFFGIRDFLLQKIGHIKHWDFQR
jgi:hypothetical protein